MMGKSCPSYDYALMLYGITNNGNRILADKNLKATCPHCKSSLVPKCGKIKIHHWAHKQAKECLYSHGMTKWHYDWLIHFNNLSSQGWEVEYFFNSVRFDVYNPITKKAIEFQRIVDIDYISQKIEICKNASIKLFWLISPLIFQSFIYTNRFIGDECDTIFASRNCKRKISVLLESYIKHECITFLIDFKKREYLPKYSTDKFPCGLSYCYSEHLGTHKHPMKQGIYIIREMPLLNDYYYRKRVDRNQCVLFLEYYKP